MSEFYKRVRIPTEAEIQTEALRNFMERHTESAKELAYWHAAINPGTPNKEMEELLDEMAQEAINEVIEHADWLREQGMMLSFQADESHVFPLVGLVYANDTGWVARISNPRTQETWQLPISHTDQFIVH